MLLLHKNINQTLPSEQAVRKKELKVMHTMYRTCLFTLLFTLLFAAIELTAAPEFPVLTGRVVDNAALLDPAQERQLSSRLEQLEHETSDQLVVVTLESLEGYDIADYGYQLGRYWGIGHEGKDNGILLIVAPAERQVRIEVGYGLEATLTDKRAHEIIGEAILPSFKNENYAEGIFMGSEAIINTLLGDPFVTSEHETKDNDSGGDALSAFLTFAFLFIALFFRIGRLFLRFILSTLFALFFGVIIGGMSGVPFAGLAAGVIIFVLGMKFKGSASGGRSVGSSSSSSSFSGGGGSFGGGGASGSW